MTDSPPRLFTPGNVLALVAILSAIGLVLFRSQIAEDETQNAESEQASLVLLELQTKLLAGVAQFDRTRAVAELDQLDSFGNTPAARRGLAAFQAYVLPPDSRQKALLQLPPPELREPLDLLVAQAIEDPSRLSPQDRANLVAQLDWFGHLLLEATGPDSARKVASASMRAMAITTAATLLLVLALGLGLFLLTLGIVRKQQGTLAFRLRPPSIHAHLYFQGFAIYLWGMILLSSLAPWAGLAGSAVAIALSLLLGVSYPLLRGVSFAEWRADLGLHRGAGFFREAAAGMAAYLALLPLLACGLALTYFLQKLGASSTGEEPSPISHPIYGMIPGASRWTLALLFFVASLLGPLVEEVMFRGALYGSLRSLAGRIISLLLMSFVFAAVHPQGLFAIPSLMAVAVSFGMMREWRSSLIAGAVMHGLHNGALLVGMLALLS